MNIDTRSRPSDDPIATGEQENSSMGVAMGEGVLMGDALKHED